ncbi:hypothetical protein CHS0354_025154 [Potamilus streckersoni]|uniref:Uncharacterized protein n=1 Tax=Potamilus streckersoni TaxID=2493646 RepID=A0AAE0RWX3_9BIVA|nr:hypothetical protein CHS0354_025154 [Potamilus streckersoni]
MVIKRKDFQKAAAFIHEFLLKLNEDLECAELRDTLNLALLHMQKYYRMLQSRTQEKIHVQTLSLHARGLSPMTPFVDAPDKFQWRWINLDSSRLLASMGVADESINITTLPSIIQAAKQGNVDLITELVHEDPSCADEQDGLGRTALTYAVHFSQMDALHCLLENEASVNTSAHDGSTAVHQACHDDNPEALRMLLEYGGDFTMQDTHGRAPIHWAVTAYTLDCLRVLIEHNADVNVRDKDGLTPCMWACRLDHIQHFELLSRSERFHVEDADGIERDIIGRTWMHWSVRRMEPLECLQTLLTAETAMLRDDDGKTVLHTAAEMGSLPATKIIIEIGGHHCINLRDKQDRTPLHLASIGGHGDVVNFLLENEADMNAVDKFNATAWDYARNRQLHYCQLIIMSHQRQRFTSNPSTPIANGLGLMFGNSSLMNGDFNGNEFDFMSARDSVESMPVTPPHPPKRPRTGRAPMLHRSQSLSERDRSREHSLDDRQISSANETMPKKNERIDLSAGDNMILRNERIDLSSPVDIHRRNERIEVSVNTRQAALEGYATANDREEVAMTTDDHLDEDIDGVSVGGMDVSDIEDEDMQLPLQTARRPHQGSQRPPGPQPNFQPRPPPRHYQPRPPPPGPAVSRVQPPPPHTQPIQPPYRKSQPEFGDNAQNYNSIQPRPPPRISTTNHRITSGFFNQRTPANTTDSYPSPNRPKPAPRPQRMQQVPKPPILNSPPPGRPGSGPSIREQITSPPLSSHSPDQSSARQDNRPDSGNTKPPGVLEGKKLMPPPLLTPLENAPKLPNIDSMEKIGKKKKKKKRNRDHSNTDAERDMKSPPEDLTPPRGYAAPLHPPPSATVRQQRAQSGHPSPKFSKGNPQRHEGRYTDESMEEEKDTEEQHPVMNGLAVPARDAPMRSTQPGQRLQPMDSDDTDGVRNSEPKIEEGFNEDEEIGPLIPPPQGFRGPAGDRPLSQSVPQDSRSSARLGPTSAKPPLPRGRNSTGSSRFKNPSPPRRTSRPTTGRTGDS